MDDEEYPNQITPRHFAVLLILSRISEVRNRIKENDYHSEPGDLFRSEIDVWLHRAVEELERAAKFLRDNDGSEDA